MQNDVGGVAFVGLGAMGWPMAGHLHERGLLTVVSNRTHAKAERFASAHDVLAVEDVAAVPNHAKVVVLCVSADQDVLDCVQAMLPNITDEHVVIDHSTVGVATAKKAAAWLAERGAGFVDAPISGGVEGAQNGSLSVMLGAEAPVFERVKEVLSVYGKRITHMGGVGAGQATKACNQVLVSGIAQAVCEGLALGDALGLSPKKLIPTLGAGAAGNWFLDKRGETMLNDEFAKGFKSSLLLKDLKLVAGMAAEAGIQAPTLQQSIRDYEQVVAQGHADDDISTLIRLKKTQG